MSLPVRGAWIEMCYERGTITPEITSLPVRGAWIEIASSCVKIPAATVAPRAGSVD